MTTTRTTQPVRRGAAPSRPVAPPQRREPRHGGGRRPPQRHRFHPALPSIAALILVLAGLAACAAGVFKVRHVEVVGSGLPAAEMVRTADVMDHNIFRVRADAVVQRLQALPQIEVSRVDTAFPDTVTIYAALRRPYIGWRVGGVTYLLDDHGRIIERAPETALPVIVGAPGAQPPGFPVLQAALYAVSALSVVPDGNVGGLRLDPARGLVVDGQAGWHATVGTGSAQTLVTRVATLAALLRKLNAQHERLAFADLRLGQPYFRVRQ